MLYADLTRGLFHYFNIDSNDNNRFLLEIFDTRYKLYVEFDDEYINRLRKRLPRTSIENILGRIVCRQHLSLLSRQSISSMGEKQTFPNYSSLVPTAITFSPPPYIIVWLDEYFASPANFRSMKRNLLTTTSPHAPISNSFWLETDIDNLIRNDCEIDLSLSIYDGHLKMFSNIDQCRDYVNSLQNNCILLITSDRNGREILPFIYDKISNTYILRNSWHDFEWGFDYIETLQMFDDEQCMLTRVVRDLARHFVDRALQVRPEEAVNYLNWAKKLYIQVDRSSLYRSFRYTSTILNYIDHQIDHLEAIVKVCSKASENE